MNTRNSNLLRTLYYHWKNLSGKHSYNHGKGNKIQNNGIKVASRIHLNGNNLQFIIEDGAVLLNTAVSITGNNSIIILHKHSFVEQAELVIEGNGCYIEIGNKTYVGNHTHIACTEDGLKIIIGGEGMISSYVQVRTGDSHSILDDKGIRINEAKSVYIDKHCWLGEGCKILKGVRLAANTVVSTGAIVTKSFNANVLIGGIPAKILKENINWDEKRI